MNSNPNAVEYFIEKSSAGRRFVISDIHGCYQTLLALLEQLSLQSDDQLFFLGDYVNKGPGNQQVVEYLLNLREQHEFLYLLMGNHEKEYLDVLDNDPALLHDMAAERNAEDLLINGEMPDRYIRFFRELPYFFELPDCWLVHAGFDFSHPEPLRDQGSMLYIRDFPYDPEQAKDKPIVHGHNPTQLETIKEAVKNKRPVVPLDNGCVYLGEKSGCGTLLCLNLDTWELISQQNLDQSKQTFFI